MQLWLLDYLCEPGTKNGLRLEQAKFDEQGDVITGQLVSESGQIFEVINGIPRFVASEEQRHVASFGDEWNHFNFTDFKINWLTHSVANTFGTTDYFKDKVIVDAGGGSGAQSLWFSEYGATKVILLELSHSVDDCVTGNLHGIRNVAVVQCSIDDPPIRDNAIDGIVYCQNVIQHTRSVEETAHALWAITGPGGEFVFNCYPLNDTGLLRWLRVNMVYRPLRFCLSRVSFKTNLLYARLMSVLRLIPGFGLLLEKGGFCVTGDVPVIVDESKKERRRRIRACTELNTFDGFGSHTYQHLKRDEEIQKLVASLSPPPADVLNSEAYFSKPPPIGVALRCKKLV